MKKVKETEFKIYPIRSCKIKITESQYSRLFLGNKLVVKGDEDLLQEQWYNDAWHWVEDAASDVADAYMTADKAVGDYVVDPLFRGIESAGEGVIDAGKWVFNATEGVSLRDLEVEFSSWLDKNVGKPAQINGAYIWSDIVRAFGEVGEIPASFGKLFSFLTDGNNWSQVGEGFKLMGITLMDWEKNLKDVAAGFGMLWDEVSGWPKELWEWLKTWTLQDWIDLAAIICFCIPYPPLWVVGFGLEGTNVAISLYKGQYKEAGLRALFLFGGALLSKAVSNTYKISADAIEEGTKTVVKVAKVAEDSGIPAARKTLAELTKGADAETKKFVTDVFERVSGGKGKKNFSGFDDVKHQMSEIKRLADKYIAEGISDARAINRATKETVGEDIYNKYFRHLAAESRVERIVLSSISGFALSYKFISWLKEKGFDEKSQAKIKKIVEDVYISGEKNTKEAQVQYDKIKGEIAEKKVQKVIASLNIDPSIKDKIDKDPNYINTDEYLDDLVKSIEDEFNIGIDESEGKHLNEEIKRIKELFSDKRLHGNLIK